MTAQIFNGRALAHNLTIAIAEHINRLTKQYKTPPSITTIIIGDDPASLLYLKRRDAACSQVGIHSTHLRFPGTTTEHEVIEAIQRLNDDPRTHGILIQYPLPQQLHPLRLMSTVDPRKDVEGLNPSNLGRTLSGDEDLVPCTPQAVVYILTHEAITLKGADSVIINHSNIVGKPLAALLINRDATVSVCHVFTKDLQRYSSAADILISGAGVVGLITDAHVKPGAAVVDVGITPTPGGVRGDVVYDNVAKKAGFITPVPGGVGPVTTAMALANMVKTFTYTITKT